MEGKYITGWGYGLYRSKITLNYSVSITYSLLMFQTTAFAIIMTNQRDKDRCLLPLLSNFQHLEASARLTSAVDVIDSRV